MTQIGIIIVAGGAGHRMGGRLPKQFMLLDGRPVLAHTIGNFAAALPGAEIVVVLPASYIEFWKNLAARFDIAPHKVVEGGTERFHSVQRGLAALASGTELVAVQDGVRPLGSAELIRRTVAAAQAHGAAIPVTEPADSFRETDGERSHPFDRRRLRIVQTPQVFRAGVLRAAYAAEYRPEFTDDASVVDAAGLPVFLCEGERQNIKITTSEDLVIAAAILAARAEAEAESEAETGSHFPAEAETEAGTEATAGPEAETDAGAESPAR